MLMYLPTKSPIQFIAGILGTTNTVWNSTVTITGQQPGDFLIAAGGSNTSVDPTFTVGWTKINSSKYNSGGNIRTGISLYKIATSSASEVLTITGSGVAAPQIRTEIFNLIYASGYGLHTHRRYPGFLNTYGCWGGWPFSKTVNFAYTGYYSFAACCDNYGYVYIDNVLVLQATDWGHIDYAEVYITAGNHAVKCHGVNYSGPASFAVTITSHTGGGNPDTPPLLAVQIFRNVRGIGSNNVLNTGTLVSDSSTFTMPTLSLSDTSGKSAIVYMPYQANVSTADGLTIDHNIAYRLNATSWAGGSSHRNVQNLPVCGNTSQIIELLN